MDLFVIVSPIALLWIWLGITPLLNGRPTIIPLRKMRTLLSGGIGWAALCIFVLLPIYWFGSAAAIAVAINLAAIAVLTMGALRVFRYWVGNAWHHYCDGYVVLGVKQERFRRAFMLALVEIDAAAQDDGAFYRVPSTFGLIALYFSSAKPAGVAVFYPKNEGAVGTVRQLAEKPGFLENTADDCLNRAACLWNTAIGAILLGAALLG